MSDEEFEKNDELENSLLNSEKGDSSNLDEYGVWIKGSSDALGEEGALSDNEAEPSDNLPAEEGDIQAFDFDGLSEDVSIEESDSLPVGTESNSSKSDSSDSSFDDIDMSDFFTDFDSDANAEADEKEDETSIKMDLNFDTVDSYAQSNEEDDFDSMLDDSNIEDVSSGNSLSSVSSTSDDDEINDLLSDLNSPSSAMIEDKNDQDTPDIELNIDVDETQDFAKLADDGKDTSLSISLESTNQVEQAEKTENKDSGIVVKNTVIEPENIDDILEKNRQVLGEDVSGNSKMEQSIGTDSSNSGVAESFNDVEALANELAEDIPPITSNATNQIASSGMISIAGLDKVTELLQDMTQELVSIREEIASLKSSVSSKDMGSGEQGGSEGKDGEETGFFKDEDTDEAIALTGDELNNILITADFTEETASEEKGEDEKLKYPKSENEVVEESVGSLEASSDDEVNFDEENDFEDNENAGLNFDDITLENSKLDDFVIPEELDYNMLNLEGGDNDTDDIPEKTEGTDMSYLDEKDSSMPIEDENQEIPESQEVPIPSDVAVSGSEDKESLPLDKDELPSNIKRDIKSVLSYMDQLLESLPEDKMKEFAESEYFEMYNRLFNELGIS